jgi:hypothetical protein
VTSVAIDQRFGAQQQARGRAIDVAGYALFLSTFLFVFGWKITPFADLILLSSAAFVWIAFLVLGEPLRRQVLAVVVPLALLSIYALALFLMVPHADLQMAQRSIRASVNFLGGAALCALYVRAYPGRWAQVMVAHLFWAIVAHAGVIILMYLNPGIRSTVYAMAQTTRYVNDNSPIALGYRVPGLTYGLSQTSVVQMFALLLLPGVLRSSPTGIVRRAAIFVGVTAVLFSMFVTGRSGLLLAGVMTPAVWLLSRSRVRARTERNALRVVRGVIAGIVALGVVAGGAVIALQSLPEYFFSYSLMRAGEIWLALTSSQDSATVDALSHMYFLPSNPLVLLFGSSNFGRGEFGMIPSDVGFVRIVYAAGLVGSVLILLPFIAGARASLRVRRVDPHLAWCTLFALGASVLLHAKEVALLTRNQWSVQAMLVCACIALAATARSGSSSAANCGGSRDGAVA